jgi:glycosyltransferase involved in cell wall biosynthesis
MGHGGIAGRNGTDRVIEAWRHVKSNAGLVVRHQSPLLPCPNGDDRITFLSAAAAGGMENYWELWSEGDVLLHPHHWDGLSLPIQEALAAGLPVMTTRYWPFCDVDHKDGDGEDRSGWLPRSSQQMSIEVASTTRQRICREIIAYETTPQAIAATIDAWYDADISAASDESRAYAEQHSWRRWLPEYQRLFDELCRA